MINSKILALNNYLFGFNTRPMGALTIFLINNKNENSKI
jgi:hypothetical protein